MARIAVTGSVAYDHIMNFPGQFKDHILADKLHVLNVSFLVQDLKRLRGGCAANIAYALKLHGLSPALVAAVGSDFEEYRCWLDEQGIDLTSTRIYGDVLTASCFITTDGQNNQITGFYPGAMGRAAEVSLSDLAGEKPILATISPNAPDAMKAYPQQCRDLGIPFLYDPGQQVIALSADELRDGLTGAKMVVANDYEQAVISDKTGLDPAGLLELCETLVVTLGEKGSRIYPRGEDPVDVPVAPVKGVVDPTGAGDAYRGGLVKGLVSGADWETCGRLGALTASYCVEVRGTSNYSFDKASFGQRFEEAFGLSVSV
jgi:adenosine kinase